jgi:hypothetical protein
MKVVILLLLCITLATSQSFSGYTFSREPAVAIDPETGMGICAPFGICSPPSGTTRNVLTPGSAITFESRIMNDLYIIGDGSNCSTTQNGICGSVNGIRVPSTLANITAVSQRTELQWRVLQTGDFYCLRSVQFNAYLYLSGGGCANTNSNGECGKVNLFKTNNTCSRDYGWTVTMVQNNYVLQSVRYPQVYFFLNGQGCDRAQSVDLTTFRLGQNTGMCGYAAGYYVANTRNVLGYVNDAYSGIYFKIPFTVAPASRLRRV